MASKWRAGSSISRHHCDMSRSSMKHPNYPVKIFAFMPIKTEENIIIGRSISSWTEFFIYRENGVEAFRFILIGHSHFGHSRWSSLMILSESHDCEILVLQSNQSTLLPNLTTRWIDMRRDSEMFQHEVQYQLFILKGNMTIRQTNVSLEFIKNFLTPSNHHYSLSIIVV